MLSPDFGFDQCSNYCPRLLCFRPPTHVAFRPQARKEELEFEEEGAEEGLAAGEDEEKSKVGSYPWSGSDREYTHEELLGEWVSCVFGGGIVKAGMEDSCSASMGRQGQATPHS